MKKIIILFLILQQYFVFAQEPPKMLKYNAKNASNVFYYDEDEVSKKIKIKKDNTKSIVTNALKVYNDKIRVITFLNNQKFQELDVIVNTMGKEARNNPDLSKRIRQRIEIVVLPIRDSIKKNEEILNTTLQPVLTEKQFKRWKKYQKRKKKELRPKQPKREEQQTSRPRNNRRRY
ncbi:hypothetical protein [Tenacibaculum aquimarinum]|uniref:hypothetical protein n=1 Tax=Tenacibaculum aquimarinum TaxID=2910675 RepID=UPI001F0B129E|nr:hypothetical protein [Tenacibaculum aquimarinum]MCH3884763.1 hypothetical protein [Tenacibaculum aquimarinum]